VIKYQNSNDEKDEESAYDNFIRALDRRVEEKKEKELALLREIEMEEKED
jgi:hypothetical protein